MESEGSEGEEVGIRVAGREALIKRGVLKWSWKAARCQRAFEELSREIQSLRARFCVPSEVAKRLHVDKSIWRDGADRATSSAFAFVVTARPT